MTDTVLAHAGAIATALVLVAALLHAVTNALIKLSGDALVTRGAMSAVAAAAMLPLLPFVAPPAREAWPILLASVPVHTAYSFLVAAAYRRGDLSVVFPVARGISPVGVALLAGIFGIGLPGWTQAAGAAVICGAILLIAWPAPANAAALRGGTFAYSAATGVVVAIYTYLDAVGLRLAGTLSGYIVWLIVLDGSLTAAAVALARRGEAAAFLAQQWRKCLLTAALGLLNFGLAMIALGLGPVVGIAALRETSVVFAAFIGTRYLGEGFGRRRIVAAVLVAAGIVLIQL
jgi:drug/metabolite transporter (DMT)-like permease